MRLIGLTWQNPRGVDPLMAAARLWRELHPDVEVVWEALPWIEFEHRLLDAVTGKCKPYDMVMLDHPWVGTLVSHSYLRAWDSLVDQSYLDDLKRRVVPPSYDSYVWHDRLWALPVDAACHAGLIREDLLAIHDLPRDWSVLGEWAKQRFDPPRSYPLVLSINSVLGNCLFLALMNSLGTPAYTDPENPTCDPEAARKILVMLSELLTFVPPGSTTWGPWDIYEYMTTHDDVSYCPQIFGYVNYFNTAGNRKLRLAGCPTLWNKPPTPILGGVGLAVTQTCREVEAASAYAMYVMSESVQRRIFPSNSGQPADRSVWDDVKINDTVNGFYSDMSSLMEHSFIRPRYSGFHDIELRNADTLDRFWSGAASLDETVEALRSPLVPNR
ncbi:MAG: extracellular solute-binding protein [Gammaproteobacteria bacterium]|nr:MAG: extracellular solute-binding protein [Gammaproteobacteria bacterium]